MKTEGDFLTVSELTNKLAEYGQVETYDGFDANGKPNGAVIAVLTVESGTLAGQEYFVSIPATNWRRVAEVDAQGNTIGVTTQTDPEVFQKSEVAAYMVDESSTEKGVQDWEKELAQKNIVHNLDPETPTLGAEFEFNLTAFNLESFEGVIREVLNEGMIELLNCQRELQPADPVTDTNHLMEMYRTIMTNVVQTAHTNGLLVNLAGTSPDIDIMMEGYESLNSTYPSKYGVYVEFVASQLMDAMTKHLHYVPEETKVLWEEVAQSNGFEGGLAQIMDEIKDLRHWLMNAGHVSINMETDRRGQASPTIIKNTNNLLIHYRNILNGLCYSGSHTFNTMVKLDYGNESADGRESLRFIMATSQPANYLAPEEDPLDRSLTRMFRGDAISPDRTGLATRFNGKELPNTHGDIRTRASISLKNLLQILDNSKVGADDPTIYIDENGTSRNLTASVRIEYTSRSMTPDPARYKQSVDIQEILFKAANLATMDGYYDIFKWMEDVVGVDIDPETEYRTNLEQRLSEQRDSLRARYPRNKLESLEKLVGYVDGRLKRDFGVGHPSKKGALDGIDALAQVPSGFREAVRDMAGDQKLELYLKGGYPNWGEFEVSLLNEDIIGILGEEETINMNRGQLLALLRDKFVTGALLFHEVFNPKSCESDK